MRSTRWSHLSTVNCERSRRREKHGCVRRRVKKLEWDYSPSMGHGGGVGCIFSGLGFLPDGVSTPMSFEDFNIKITGRQTDIEFLSKIYNLKKDVERCFYWNYWTSKYRREDAKIGIFLRVVNQTNATIQKKLQEGIFEDIRFFLPPSIFVWHSKYLWKPPSWCHENASYKIFRGSRWTCRPSQTYKHIFRNFGGNVGIMNYFEYNHANGMTFHYSYPVPLKCGYHNSWNEMKYSHVRY